MTILSPPNNAEGLALCPFLCARAGALEKQRGKKESREIEKASRGSPAVETKLEKGRRQTAWTIFGDLGSLHYCDHCAESLGDPIHTGQRGQLRADHDTHTHTQYAFRKPP